MTDPQTARDHAIDRALEVLKDYFKPTGAAAQIVVTSWEGILLVLAEAGLIRETDNTGNDENAALVISLRKMANTVYLATNEAVADDLNGGLLEAAAMIESLSLRLSRARSSGVADTVKEGNNDE